MVYLKSVEAYGFKSFAEKTVVTFDEGLTAIVGPNGSGKSNITDAIRWVLGEQSAKNLRGARMEDVIFSGAAAREALNYAMVTLTLDNKQQMIDSDEEIKVTRKLYRSGESEYFLNSHKVRLKDITELFLDTGLGKEAFSIISQGKVDEILNAKAEDRRHLIEEAAGVLKYKKRKKETTQKLNETMLNLSRVSDIIFDLEGRIGPLEEEAAIAAEYEALSAEMKDADIQVTVHDIEQQKAQHLKLEQEIREFNEMIALKTDKADRIQGTLQSEQSALKEAKEQFKTQSEMHLRLIEEIERTTGRLGILAEKKENQAASLTRLKEAQQKLQDKQKKAALEMKQLQSEKQTLTQSIAALKEEEQQINRTLTTSEEDIELLIEETRDKFYEIASAETNDKNEIKLFEKQLEEIELFLESQDESSIEAFDVVNGQYNEVQQQLKIINQQLEESRAKYKALSRDIEMQQSAYKTSEEKLHQAYRYIDQLKTKRSSIKAMQDEYQGYYSGVKAALKSKLQGLRGPVMQLIDVPADYRIALDIALGQSVQHIVTNDEASARDAINHLKRNKLGRATFLPLTTIKGRTVPAAEKKLLTEAEGFVGVLSELISYSAEYEQVMQQLMGRIVVAEDLKNASNIAKLLGYKYRIVTLDGNIISPGGAMTGGSVNQPSILLKQQGEAEELGSRIAEYESHVRNYEQETNALKSKLRDATYELEVLKNFGEETSLQKQELIFRKGEIENQLSSLQHRFKQHEEMQRKAAEKASLKQRITQKQTAIAQAQVKLIELEEQLKQLSEDKQGSKLRSEERAQQKATVQSKRIQQQENLKYTMQRITAVEADSAELKRESEQLSSQGEHMSAETLAAHIAEEKRALSAAKSNKSQLQDALHTLNETIESLESSTDQKQTDYKELLRQINNLESGIGEMKGRYSRIDVNLENLIYHLMEDYHITYEAALEMRYDADIEHLRKRVTLTKRSIEELGPVNMSAIAQFKEVKERYDFLKAQEDDLLGAKATLEAIIRDMDHEVSSRFEETFTAVQEHFKSTFSELFGGGTGELLLDSDNLLEAGVQIVIEPPGKKRQHLTLLSGGERALTAVALLFAILKVRSAPFVILDEVEAALDEANVLRFGSYLKRMSLETQFIVITHRKGTMESADRLYGVTMQNSGITQLISVNLSELDNQKVKELTK